MSTVGGARPDEGDAEEEDEPEFSFEVEEDLNRKDQLFIQFPQRAAYRYEGLPTFGATIIARRQAQ